MLVSLIELAFEILTLIIFLILSNFSKFILLRWTDLSIKIFSNLNFIGASLVRDLLIILIEFSRLDILLISYYLVFRFVPSLGLINVWYFGSSLF